MPRVVGVDIPERKAIRYALRYIHGVGPKVADEVLEALKIDPTKKAGELTDNEVASISQHLDSEVITEGSLRRQVAQNVQRLRDIRSYRGDRHRRGLPSRGQRTRTNARTRKGRKKTVAGKKGAKG